MPGAIRGRIRGACGRSANAWRRVRPVATATLVLTLAGCALQPTPRPTQRAGTATSRAAPTVTMTTAVTATAPASPTPEPTSTRSAYWQTQVAAVNRTSTMRWVTSADHPADPGAPGRFTSISFVSATNGFALGHVAVPIPAEPYAIALGHTTDGGATWESRALPDRGVACLKEWPEILFQDDQVGWLRCHGLLATNDGGWTWQVLSATDPVIDWGRSPGGQLWIWMKEETGASAIRVPSAGALDSWRTLIAEWPHAGVGPISGDWPHPVSVWDDRTIAYAEQDALDGSGYQTIWWATTDGGATWQELAEPCIRPDWMSQSVSVGPEGIAWAGCGGMPGGTLQDKRLTRSVDSGQDWAVVGEAPILRSGPDLDMTAAPVTANGHLWAIQALSRSAAYALLGRASGPLITRDAGRTWSTPILWPCTVPDSNLFGGFFDAEHGWIAGARGLARTDDGGATWTCYVYAARP